MKRTTVYLEERTDLEFGRLAKQKGRSKAELMREAMRRYLEREDAKFEVPDWVGIGVSHGDDAFTAAELDIQLGQLIKKDNADTTAGSETLESE